MDHARRLYLIDEFDRQYKQLQRPIASIAKTCSAIQLTDTLRDKKLDEHEKVRQYVAELQVSKSKRTTAAAAAAASAVATETQAKRIGI